VKFQCDFAYKIQVRCLAQRTHSLSVFAVMVTISTFTRKHGLRIQYQNPNSGHLGGSVVRRLPLVQVMIPASLGRAPYQAPCSAGSLLLPLPLPLLVFPLSLSLSLSNK